MSKEVGIVEFIGRSLRERREAAHLLQEDVGAAARSVGMAWTQSTVAQIEAGTRRVSLPEFLLLPAVFRQLHKPLELSDLFKGAAAGIDRVRLTPETTMSPLAIDQILDGSFYATLPGDIEAPYSESAKKATAELVGKLRTLRDRRWPKGHLTDIHRALTEGGGEAERKASRRLHIPADDLAVVAFKLWGVSLTTERERRVGERLHNADARTVQATRGAVTRQLLSEISGELAS